MIAAGSSSGKRFPICTCHIVDPSVPAEALQEALPYLLMAETDFGTLQILRSLMDVQYLLSVVYHNLGSEAERDGAIKRHFTTEAELKRLEVIAVDEEVRDIWQIVSDVGASLASR
jgi:anaphase-promoting complex subunit 5